MLLDDYNLQFFLCKILHGFAGKLAKKLAAFLLSFFKKAIQNNQLFNLANEAFVSGNREN
jgi:hypothetical protein